MHGYEDLEIIMWMHKRSFHTFVEVNFSRKRAVGGRKPDDIDDLLNGWMPQGKLYAIHNDSNGFPLFDSEREARSVA